MSTMLSDQIERLQEICRTRPLYLWGAGKAGVRAVRVLRDHGIEPAGFVDISTEKQATKVEGLDVRPPEILSGPVNGHARGFALISSIHAHAISEDATRRGLIEGRDFANMAARTGPTPDPETERIACPFCDVVEAVSVRTAGDIVRCDRCSTVYLRTRNNAAARHRTYQRYADEGSHMACPADPAGVKSSGLRRPYLLDELMRLGVTIGRYLDVGCGWGALLDEARDRGFAVQGVELTKRSAAYACLRLQIPVVNGDFDTVHPPEGVFSVVSMVHVLEHLAAPKAALERIHGLLRPGGVYFGIVPNFASLCSRTEGDNWLWLDPHYHYVHYTPDTLRRHLEEAGFTIERIYTATGDYGRAPVLAAARAAYPGEGLDDDALIQRIEREMQGEEIRFFARRG
jgi:SAM-dependent methyltransferase